MSDRPPPASPAEHVATRSATPVWQRWSVLLPVLTFVAGLVLGASALAITQSGDAGRQQPLAQASPTEEPVEEPVEEPTPEVSPGALRVTVPAPCVRAAEKAEVAFEVLDGAVAAVRDFDARRLADIVDRAQLERAMTEELIEQCEDAAGMQLVESIGSPVGSPSP